MKKRALVTQIGTLLLVIALTAVSWSRDFGGQDPKIKSKTSMQGVAASEERYLFGALLYLRELRERMPDAYAQVSSATESLYQTVFGVTPKLLTSQEKHDIKIRPGVEVPVFVLSRVVLSAVAGERELLGFFLPMLSENLEFKEQFAKETELVQRFLRCLPTGDGVTDIADGCEVISETEGKQIVETLGWVGTLVDDFFKVNLAGRHQAFAGIVSDQLVFFQRLTVLFVAIFSVLSLGALFGITLLLLRMNKKLTSHFSLVPQFRDYGLEIFGLYLLGMAIISVLSEFLHHKGVDLLMMNVVMIPLMLLLVFWPNRNVVTFSKTREALGLTLGSFKRFLVNLSLVPVIYCAGITFLMVSLLGYSVILQKFNIDVSQAAHPIIPVVLNSGGSRVWLIFCLAVVVAPIVEEVMFRGALYSWLRARLNVKYSILVSSFVFAVVHPQGLVGVLPLMVIGAVLAVAREWRGSLLTPMLIHACINCGTLFVVLNILGG